MKNLFKCKALIGSDLDSQTALINFREAGLLPSWLILLGDLESQE